MDYRRALRIFIVCVAVFVPLAGLAIYAVLVAIGAPSWSAVGGGILSAVLIALQIVSNAHDGAQFVQKLAATEKPLTPEDTQSLQRNRELLLKKVYKIWIENDLNLALINDIRVALGVQYHPWEVKGGSVRRVAIQKPDGMYYLTEKSTAHIFDDNAGELLILGAPGSGKTFTLLELAKELLMRAQQDPSAPIPVVLNLSSWARQKLPLEQWIAEEMNLQYGVKLALTQTWLKKDELILLLDGLDEMEVGNSGSAAPNKSEAAACVRAINSFQEKYGDNFVVCSREEDYHKLNEPLKAMTSMCLQPLTAEQIEDYLQQVGEGALYALSMLKQDKELHKLAETPLMLSLIALKYQHAPNPEEGNRLFSEEDGSQDHEAALRRTLFKDYILRMFSRRPWPERVSYDMQQALQWLRNVALGMNQQTIFYIERLQYTWLPTPAAQRHYRILSTGTLFLLNTSLLSLVGILNWGLVGGLVVGLVGGLVAGLDGKGYIELVEDLRWTMPSFQSFTSLFLATFLIGFLPFLSLGLVDAIGWGGIGFLLMPIAVTTVLAIPLAMLWRWVGLSESELVGGLVLGLVWGLVVGLNLNLQASLLWGLVSGLVVGLVVGLVGGGFQGSESRDSSVPNQSIRQSARNAFGFVAAGAVGGLLFAAALWMLDGLLLGILQNTTYARFGGGWRGALIAGLPSGLLMGYLVSLSYGMRAVIQHRVLRYLLLYYQQLPFLRDQALVKFLDHMSEFSVLQRRGGGWLFRHRSLLEYVAALSNDDIARLCAEIEQEKKR